MPVLQASIKDARQSEERRARRQPYKTAMKTLMRKVQELARDGKTTEAVKVMPLAMKAIDTAAKKNIIHWKNAAKKKSLLARSLSPKKKAA